MMFDLPTVFVLRADESSMRFTWEIRRFGGITLHRGRMSFPTGAAARQAGLAALERLEARTPEQGAGIEQA